MSKILDMFKSQLSIFIVYKPSHDSLGFLKRSSEAQWGGLGRRHAAGPWILPAPD